MATETTSTRTDFSIQLLLIGDWYVGRTCILERFSEDVFKPYIPYSGRAKDIIQSIDGSCRINAINPKPKTPFLN